MEGSRALHQRLLRDIAEFQNKPYPNVELRVHDNDIRKACLILTPEGWPPMHLTITFLADYPLRAPNITMQSNITHPNVFRSYICASILNTEEGYTPAYTLKGIVIQLLSFFGSETLEQSSGDQKSLAVYRFRSQESSKSDYYRCLTCNFGSAAFADRLSARNRLSRNPNRTTSAPQCSTDHAPIDDAPDDVLLEICDSLDDEELLLFAQAWSRVGKIITAYNVIHTRELQCFCLKKDFRDSKLGIGVNVIFKGKQGSLESEFDLLSLEAFNHLHVRRSVQGLPFNHWLPLPLSEKHWNLVKGTAEHQLALLRNAVEGRQGIPTVGRSNTSGTLQGMASADILFQFMNDVVVKLNKQADQAFAKTTSYKYNNIAMESSKSTLKHASEKAIESYYHLFHLLLCLVTSESDHQTINSANQKITAFLNGATSKKDIPNLGHLLIALLISSIPITPTLIRAIIQEAITRNVLWTLNQHPELAYLESDPISPYRLHHTFAASQTSYRLLLFLNLFRRTVRPPGDNDSNPNSNSNSTHSHSLAALRDDLFTRHGAPPAGTAASFAETIKRYHAQVNSFPAFLKAMNLPVPRASTFTEWLRGSVMDSMERGYSRWTIQQGEALSLRIEKEARVGWREDVRLQEVMVRGERGISFFPDWEEATEGARGSKRWRGSGSGSGRNF